MKELQLNPVDNAIIWQAIADARQLLASISRNQGSFAETRRTTAFAIAQCRLRIDTLKADLELRMQTPWIANNLSWVSDLVKVFSETVDDSVDGEILPHKQTILVEPAVLEKRTRTLLLAVYSLWSIDEYREELLGLLETTCDLRDLLSEDPTCGLKT